jgi:hypothetical protein
VTEALDGLAKGAADLPASSAAVIKILQALGQVLGGAVEALG